MRVLCEKVCENTTVCLKSPAIKREKQLWRQNIAMQQRMRICGGVSIERSREGGGLIRWSQEPPLLPADCNMWGLLLIY